MKNEKKQMFSQNKNFIQALCHKMRQRTGPLKLKIHNNIEPRLVGKKNPTPVRTREPRMTSGAS